jgi:hypothetical protein
MEPLGIARAIPMLKRHAMALYKKGFFIDKAGESFYMPPLIIKEFMP